MAQKRMTVDEAGRLGGSVRSERKAEAARQNAKLSEGRPRKPLSDIACNCGAGDTVTGHKAVCLRGRAIKRREQKGQPLE
jgi:hypothetical protein